MTKQAQAALRACQIRRNQGPHMARAYAAKRGATGAYRLARQLEVMK